MKYFSKLTYLLFLLLIWSCGEQEKVSIPPVEVAAFEVVKKDVPIIVEFVGETRGLLDIDITARVDGWVQALHFKEGGAVRKGQLLYTIDPAPFIAKVNQAKGSLAEAKTMVVKAQNDYNRIKPLAEMKAMSQKDLDAAVAALGAAEGKEEASQASLKSAEIELGYTKITSPANGVIGVSKAREGDYVGVPPNHVVLNTVSDISSIRVRFSITEKDYFSLRKQIEEAEKSGQERKKFLPYLYLADGSLYEYTGTMNIADRQVDPETGTLLLEALFPNPDELLIPGLFVRISGEIAVLKDAMIVPQRAVRELQGIYQVVVIDDQNKVSNRNVEVGTKYKDFWVIQSGLEPGDKVAVIGNQALGKGVPVKAKPLILNVDSLFKNSSEQKESK